MTKRSRWTLGVLALAGLALVLGSGPAFAAGGTVIAKNDSPGVDSFDGFCTCLTTDGSIQEFHMRFRSGELDPSSIGSTTTIVCGAHNWVYNFDAGTYTGDCSLRPEDPGNPGYADLTTSIETVVGAGVYPFGYSDSFATFGGGAGVAVDVTSPVFLCWQHPPLQPPICGVCEMLDTTNPNGASNDSIAVTTGSFFRELTADYQMDMTVVFSSPIDARFSAHGSQRFPGDKGNSIVYSRRPNAADPTGVNSDDRVSFTLVIDNTTGGPFTGNIRIDGDKGNAIPKLGKGVKNITNFFSPKISNPVVIPTGRSVLNGSLKVAIKDKFVPLMPINLPGIVTITENGSGSLADHEQDTWGLRGWSGQYDAGTDEMSFLVNGTTLAGDVLAVQFPAIDLPSTADYVISGASVVGSEFGGSGLPGYDYVFLTAEDPILTAPDDSPNGLLRAVGSEDGVGEVSVGGGGVATEAVVDFTPNLSVPVTDPFFTTINYWLKVGLTPGDSFTLGTAVVADNQASTRQKNSYFRSGPTGAYTRISFFGLQNVNLEERLQINGQLGTLAESRPTGRTPKVKAFDGVVPAVLIQR